MPVSFLAFFDSTWPNCAFDSCLCRDREIFLKFTFFLSFLPFFGGKIPDNLDIGSFWIQHRRKIFFPKNLSRHKTMFSTYVPNMKCSVQTVFKKFSGAGAIISSPKSRFQGRHFEFFIPPP